VLARGDRVVLAARNVHALESFFAEPDTDRECAHALTLDVTASPDELKAAMELAIARWGRVDVLVNNAGFGDVIPSEECRCACPRWTRWTGRC
jgi:NAD(P)-dependent dehydrogenase (short-subunit alcohol dehydrogenase family)